MSDDEYRFYRRRLPHFRLEDATYFVTWRIARGAPDLSPAERTCIAAAIQYFDRVRYDLDAWVVMNDHIHVVVTPLGRHQLEHIMHSWRSYTTNALWRLGRVGTVWQPEYRDRVIRDENEFERTVEYVFGNPQARWPELEHYSWVWVKAEDD